MAITQEKKIGQGVTWTWATTTIGQVKTMTPPALTIPSDVDVTDLDDTFINYLPSRPYEVGDFQIEYFSTPGADIDAAFDTAIKAYTVGAVTIVYANLTTSKTWSFSGYIKSLSPGAFDGKTAVSRTITIKPTTAVTET